ncbi:MAG: hypothetical protein EP148_08855 [Dialister invisus]|uniref:hypothetical protein n=1 Tax=Dialister invisus TaxID=218538 RepID=UPI000A581F62|nr:hypothetical protein [Dialister invisus]MUU09952.1 hypothetical protein [Dialister invisus]
MGKTENGMVTQSEESVTLMTSYRLPRHGSRSFTFTHYDALPSAVILNGGKHALWERRKTGW